MTQLSFDQTLASIFHWTMNKTMNIKTISCNLYLIYIQKNNPVLESRRVSLTFNQFSISRKKKKENSTRYQDSLEFESKIQNSRSFRFFFEQN